MDTEAVEIFSREAAVDHGVDPEDHGEDLQEGDIWDLEEEDPLRISPHHRHLFTTYPLILSCAKNLSQEFDPRCVDARTFEAINIIFVNSNL